jgi:hypothetical protein
VSIAALSPDDLVAMRAMFIADAYVCTRSERERAVIEALQLPPEVLHVHVNSLIAEPLQSASDAQSDALTPTSPQERAGAVAGVQTSTGPRSPPSGHQGKPQVDVESRRFARSASASP